MWRAHAIAGGRPEVVLLPAQAGMACGRNNRHPPCTISAVCRKQRNDWFSIANQLFTQSWYMTHNPLYTAKRVVSGIVDSMYSSMSEFIVINIFISCFSLDSTITITNIATPSGCLSIQYETRDTRPGVSYEAIAIAMAQSVHSHVLR